MVRAAAKNFRDVLIVVDPRDYPRVLEDLAAPGGSSPAFRFELSRRAFAHTAAYDATIASTLETIGTEADPFARPAETPALPSTMRLSLPQRRVLRYGENPHQAAAWYATEPAQGFSAVEIKQGKELSYTNLLDLDAAARIALEFDEPAAAVIKHANPCGVATASTIAAGLRHRARRRRALGLRRHHRPQPPARRRDGAGRSSTTFIEAVIAPAVDEAALPILAAKKNLRVLTADFAPFRDAARPGVELRSILGGMLVQERDRVVEARGALAGRGRRRAARRHEAAADGGGVAGAALRLARLRARQVEHDPVRRRRTARAPSAPAR